MENFQLNIFGVLSLFGTLQGVILVFIFIFNENYSRKSNQYLTVLLLLCSTFNFIGMLEETDAFDLYPILLFAPIRHYSLVAPVVYFFIQYLINPNYKFKRWEYLLFIPFVVDIFYQCYMTINYMSGNLDWEQDLQRHYIINNTFETVASIFNLTITLVGIKTIWTYEKSLYNEYAEISDKSLKWLFNTLMGGCVITLIWLVTSLLDYFPSVAIVHCGRVIWLGISILIYWIGYAMLMRPELFIDKNEIKIEAPSNGESKLSGKTEDHYQKLLSIIEEQELYRDPNLNMDLLAQKVDLSKGYLSQIINSKVEKNFFDFINTYRVEDVKQKLIDPSFDHYNILGIALEAGFKSKSTFNSVFKKMTGKTPSQFKNHKN